MLVECYKQDVKVGIINIDGLHIGERELLVRVYGIYTLDICKSVDSIKIEEVNYAVKFVDVEYSNLLTNKVITKITYKKGSK